MSKEKAKKQILSGSIWKLGCNWGSAKPSFYAMLKKYSIVIGVDSKMYNIGDLILIAEGYTIKALAQIIEAPQNATDRVDLKEEFTKYEINYDSWMRYYKVLFYELPKGETFQYKLQQGICKVQNASIKETALTKWAKLTNLTTDEASKFMSAEKIEYSKNTILYGPPGTGKTFKLNELKEKYFTNYDIDDGEEFSLRAAATSPPLWKILAAILGTSKKPIGVTEIVQHPLIVARVKPSNKTKPNAAVWSDLQSSADDESTQLAEKYRRSVKLFHKNENSEWTILPQQKEELPNIVGQDLLDLAANPKKQNEYNKTASIKRYEFVTFHQKYSYEDFIEGIKPVLAEEDGDLSSSDLQFMLKKGMFYESCLKALNLAGYSSFDECYNDSFDNRKQKFDAIEYNDKKQFAIFIDEINRANISAVFGELITLLEEDKRIGKVHPDGIPSETWVKLPTSNEPFCVPPNLYVIGSMNTADRSIALLDIALRRRFEFVPLYPEYPNGTWWTELLRKLNESIYKNKGIPDFFIGHAFFINKDEKDRNKILNNKIIPLLYEYYQNNINKVKSTLEEAEIDFDPPNLDNNYQIRASES